VHEGRVSSEPANPAGEGRASTGSRRPRYLTTMGVLETLMWCAGAGGLLAVWLWSGSPDIPAFGRATIERSRAAVRPPGATANVRPDPNIEVLQDHSRAPKIRAVQDRGPDPISTGSASPAPPVARSVDSPNTDSALGQPGEGAADGHAEIAAVIEIGPQEVSVEPGRPAEDAEGPTLLQAAIPLPSQPLALDLFGFPSLETVSGLPEGIVLQVAIAPVPAEAPPDKVISNEAEPPQVTLPEVQIAVAEVIASNSLETSGPQVRMTEQRPERATESKSVDRDLLVRRGEGLLAQGDVAGARLFFGRAAADGDPRGATGMARSFDPEALRKLRVLGIRPDPEQAAQWYARSKVLQAVASTR
jgi:hypothetical protein